MAVFTVAIDDDRNRLKYKTETDLYNLIHYILKESKYTLVLGLIPGNAKVLTNQFLYAQHCKGQELDTRALHFILSYDTKGWEWEMDIKKSIESISILLWLRTQFRLEEYETIIVAHDNGKNCNIHIIVNPVNKITRKILHYNQNELQSFLKELAFELYMKYGIALLGISYIGENDRCILENSAILYENRMYHYEPLR